MPSFALLRISTFSFLLVFGSPSWGQGQQPGLGVFGGGNQNGDGPIAAGGPNDGVGNGNNGAGGGGFADFGSLMQLIETTVVPETWESLGGPSGMFPYPQGVYVDAGGTLRDCVSVASDDPAEQLRSLVKSAASSNNGMDRDWKQPSPLRCVSLRGLAGAHAHFTPATPESVDCMAGLSEIQYLFVTEDDVIIAGPIGGLESFQGWHRDRVSGQSAIRFDFFATCFRSAFASQPFGCTIDPTVQGLQRAAQVANSVQNKSLPIGVADTALAEALGMQQIEVFGTAGDTPIGYVMVEADRHMKQLALGIHDLPESALSYLDVIEQTIDQGPPQDLLLRLWFTARPRAIRSSSDRKIFELAGTPIRLSGQNERALASGKRGQITHDPRTKIFVDDFNTHWPEIRSKYPIYGALESIYQSAAAAEVVRRYVDAKTHQSLFEAILGIDTSSIYQLSTPRQVESIAVLHSFRHGAKNHHILIASGGVAVTPTQTVRAKLRRYPTLDSTRLPKKSQPPVVQQWWWDVDAAN